MTTPIPPPPLKPTSPTAAVAAAAAKFEADKARKEKHGNPTPWSREVWQAATAAYLAGVVEPERRFPVIITTGSTGPFTTREQLQEVTGLPSLPEVQWTTVTSIYDDDQEEEEERADQGCTGTITDPESTKKKKKQKKEPEKVQYCHVNWEQRERVKEYSDGENVIVWFQEKKRYAWLAHSVKQQGGEEEE
jgi:hypothetical protein